MWVAGIESEIDRAGVLVFVEDLLPIRSAIERAEDSTFCIGSIGMTQHRRENPLRIVRVNQNGANLLSVPQSQVLPLETAIRGFINSVPHAEVGTSQAFSTAGVDDLRIGRCHRQRPNRASRLLVKDRFPRATVVVALPDTAIVCRHVVDVLFPRYSRDRHRTASTKWTD